MIGKGSLCKLKFDLMFASGGAPENSPLGHYSLLLDKGELMFVLNAPFQANAGTGTNSTWTFLTRFGLVSRIGSSFLPENWLNEV